MAKQKAKVKSQFTHQGKQYQPGQEFEGEQQEIERLAAQGHLEHPQGGTIGHEHGPGGQPPAGGQAQTPGGSGATPGGQQQTGPHDPSTKQGR